MNTFQNLLDDDFKKLLSFPSFATRIVRKKLKDEGIELTDKQTDKIIEIFSKLEKDGKLGKSLQLELGNDGSITVVPEKQNGSRVINLADTADEEIDQLLDRLPEIYNEVVSNLSREILKILKADANRMLREHANIQHGFEKRLYSKWKLPLHLMEMFLVIAEEAGSEYNHYISTTTNVSRAYKFEVLRRLHARACQVAKEVLVLLKSGFADGAHGRWRTLHEISVIGNFINHHGNSLAERYLLHEIIESYKSARLYQEYCSQLDFKPLSYDEVESLRRQTSQLIARFGRDFKNNYGWASEVLANKNPTFSDIERAVEMRHIRPFYKLANINVHAGSRGMQFRLGLSEDQRDKILLAGASDIGLADPGQNTIYSLMMATSNLLTYQSNLDSLVVLNVMMQLEQEIFDAFDKQEYKYS